MQNKHTPQDKNSNFFKSLNNMEKTYTLKIYTAGVNGQWIMADMYSGLRMAECTEHMNDAFVDFDYCECIVTPEK